LYRPAVLEALPAMTEANRREAATRAVKSGGGRMGAGVGAGRRARGGRDPLL